MSSQPPVVALAELIQMLGLSKTRVLHLAAREAFPEPVARLRVGQIWSYAEVAAFCAQTGRAVHPIGTSASEG